MKAVFKTHLTVGEDAIARNIAYAKTLDLPAARHPGKWHQHPLAIIGSSPSVGRYVRELRGWPGDRWAVNTGFRWARENGIDCDFMTADPVGWDVSFIPDGTRVYLASYCDPSLFDATAGRCDVKVYEFAPGGVIPLSTSAGCAMTLGPMMGYRHVVMFGCESSFADPGRSNIVGSEDHAGLMWIRCGHASFLTSPGLLIQAELMAAAICKFPGIYSERSGGLLGAMVENQGDYHVAGCSADLGVYLVKPSNISSGAHEGVPVFTL